MDNNGQQWITMDNNGHQGEEIFGCLNIYFTKYSGKARFLKGG